MKIYPEDIQKVVTESKAKAEASKSCVKTPKPNNNQLDQQWESVRRSRQQ